MRQVIIDDLTAQLESACSVGAAVFSTEDPISTAVADSNSNMVDNVVDTAASANPIETVASVGRTAVSEDPLETAVTVADAAASGMSPTAANGEGLEDGEIDPGEIDDGRSTTSKHSTATSLAIASIVMTSPAPDDFESRRTDGEHLLLSPADVNAALADAAAIDLQMVAEGESATAAILSPSHDAFFKVLLIFIVT